MVKEFYFKSSTGKDLYAKIWKDNNVVNYKGIVQLEHGMEEDIRRYEDFATYLMDEGFIVVGHDHLGHGKSVKSDKELGDFDCKDGWFRMTEDMHILQNEISLEYQNIPYFILGHSMGSLLTRTYLTIYKDNIKGIILSGTSGKKSFMLYLGVMLSNMIKLFKGPKYKSELMSNMVTGSFNKKFKPNRTECDWLTRDEKLLDESLKFMNPNRKFTIESYMQMLKGSIYINKRSKIKNIPNVPILLLSGANDPVGEMGKGVKRVYNMFKKAKITDITMKLYEGGRHEMLNEINRDEVYKYIEDWIEDKTR